MWQVLSTISEKEQSVVRDASLENYGKAGLEVNPSESPPLKFRFHLYAGSRLHAFHPILER